MGMGPGTAATGQGRRVGSPSKNISPMAKHSIRIDNVEGAGGLASSTSPRRSSMNPVVGNMSTERVKEKSGSPMKLVAAQHIVRRQTLKSLSYNVQNSIADAE